MMGNDKGIARLQMLPGDNVFTMLYFIRNQQKEVQLGKSQIVRG